MENIRQIIKIEIAVRNTEREKERLNGYMKRYEEKRQKGGRK
ncbi:hypothetical protein AALD22_26965 [Lachnospiraceae bacterium 56-18]